MKFLELATKVLTEAKKPMSASEIWAYANEKGYVSQLETKGRTPDYTLGARLYTAVGDMSNGKFATVGVRPKRFYLPGITPKNTLQTPEVEAPEQENKIATYKEKDLHCVLAYFAKNYLDVFPKTINHSTSKKKEHGEWMHPDMVGCYFPRHHWKTNVNVYELSQLVGDVQLGLYSFEIKQRLSFSNLRESFFQAVSNSSWAHEGFLVTAELNSDHEFHQELNRLCGAFGIGIILLDPKSPDDSQIIIDARGNEAVDWDTVNKLSSINPDFAEFIDRVKKDVSSKEIREEWYDKILDAEEIGKKFKDWR